MHHLGGMTKSFKKSWGVGLLLLAGAYFFIVYVLPVLPPSTEGASASEGCIRPQRNLIAKGLNPDGKFWTVTATVRNNGGCDAWLLGFEFVPSGSSAGSWKGAWTIPAGGHLSKGFTISAQDDVEGTQRAFSGIAGVRAGAIAVSTSGGEEFTIHPKLPREQLRKRFVWLRNVKYFIRFYPPGQHVKIAKVLNSRGEVISRAAAFEGEFEGRM
jgi:hypothetical protein